MDVIPELAEPGKAQGIVGHEASAVVNHEDKSAREEQQPDQTEKSPDHASPIISKPKGTHSALAAGAGKFNLTSLLLARQDPRHGPLAAELESVDAARMGLYKTAQWRWARSRRRCSLGIAGQIDWHGNLDTAALDTAALKSNQRRSGRPWAFKSARYR